MNKGLSIFLATVLGFVGLLYGVYILADKYGYVDQEKLQQHKENVVLLAKNNMAAVQKAIKKS